MAGKLAKDLSLLSLSSVLLMRTFLGLSESCPSSEFSGLLVRFGNGGSGSFSVQV